MSYLDSKLTLKEKKHFDAIIEELKRARADSEKILIKEEENLLLGWMFVELILEGGTIRYIESDWADGMQELPERLFEMGARELAKHAKRILKFFSEFPSTKKERKLYMSEYGKARFDVFWEIDSDICSSSESCQDIFHTYLNHGANQAR